jgi:DNA-directed RNA polymerase subunit RPC12/RpoP
MVFLFCMMNFIPVIAFNEYVEANIVLGRLQSEDINCWLKDENTSTITPFLSNAIGGIKLMVAEPQLERAKEILAEIDSERKKRFACPNCGSHNIEFITTPRKPGNWFSVLLGLLWASYAMPIEKVYHCFNCGKEFKTPIESDATLEEK